MRLCPLVTVVLALSACAPRIPDSAAGVGTGAASNTQADLRPLDATTLDATTRGAAGSGVNSEAAQIAAETQAALAAVAATPDAGAAEAEAADPPVETVSAPTGISQENEFAAVDDVRSIERDAALIARNREKYQVIAPDALPVRPGDTGPNIVDYALATTHPVGTRVYARLGLNARARQESNCARYASDDQAQLAFLANGGPERDRRGLDPDGDGYACDWSPDPFRKAVGG